MRSGSARVSVDVGARRPDGSRLSPGPDRRTEATDVSLDDNQLVTSVDPGYLRKLEPSPDSLGLPLTMTQGVTEAPPHLGRERQRVGSDDRFTLWIDPSQEHAKSSDVSSSSDGIAIDRSPVEKRSADELDLSPRSREGRGSSGRCVANRPSSPHGAGLSGTSRPRRRYQTKGGRPAGAPQDV